MISTLLPDANYTVLKYLMCLLTEVSRLICTVVLDEKPQPNGNGLRFAGFLWRPLFAQGNAIYGMITCHDTPCMAVDNAYQRTDLQVHEKKNSLGNNLVMGRPCTRYAPRVRLHKNRQHKTSRTFPLAGVRTLHPEPHDRREPGHRVRTEPTMVALRYHLLLYGSRPNHLLRAAPHCQLRRYLRQVREHPLSFVSFRRFGLCSLSPVRLHPVYSSTTDFSSRFSLAANPPLLQIVAFR